MSHNDNKDFRSGFAAVVGRPNAGKSTLLNTLLGQKVLIISDKPQTTRNRIQCILTEKRGQIIFFDTPGIHKPKHQLGEYMVIAAQSALRGVDFVVYVIDASVPFGTGDQYVIDMIQASKLPVIAALNKIDLLKKEELLVKIDQLSKVADFKHIIPISALKGENTAVIVDEILKELPLGPMYFPEDSVTDQPEKFVIAELIREKILLLTRDEVPHSTAVVVEQMEDKKSLVKINAVILLERDSQKGIVIGKQGSLLKEIGRQARGEIEKLLASKVFLELFVKVRKDWRNQQNYLRQYGYDADILKE